jgi:rsbT co-antagonist protein RsbR
MDSASQQILGDILGRCRDELVDRATDWVREHAPDLNERPREETRALVTRVIGTQAEALLDGNREALDGFVDFVTSLRASSEFHVSTVLRGLLSFRAALEVVLRREVADGWTALAVLTEVDRVAHAALCAAADLYNDKLNHTILERRAALEADLEAVREARERELDEKLRTIEAQREALSLLSAPVIRVWEGILVIPLVGELDAGRADVIREKVLQSVVSSRARVVLVEVTGLADFDERVASEVLRLVGCVRLLGSDAMLVGISPMGARVLADFDDQLSKIRSFTTLYDALRASLMVDDLPASERRTGKGARERRAALGNGER